MSAVTLPDASRGRAGVLASVRSEWTKVRSVRSSWVSLLILVVAALGLAALVTAAQASRWGHLGIEERALFDPLRFSQAGHFINQFVVGVFAILIVTSEYSTGSVRTTLSAMPRRLNVLAAKGIVVLSSLLVLTEIVSFASFFLSQAILAGNGGKALDSGAGIRAQLVAPHAPYVTLGTSGVVAALFRSGLYLVLLAMIGFGIAWLIRSTPGAITTYAIGLLIVPLILQLLPSSIANPIERYMPLNLGTAMVAIHTRHSDLGGTLLSPWAATAVMAIYAVFLVALGAWSLQRRDA